MRVPNKIHSRYFSIILAGALLTLGTRTQSAKQHLRLPEPTHALQTYEKTNLLGKSKMKRDIEKYRFQLNPSADLPEQRIFIQSGLHGNESTPVAFTYWLMHQIANGKSKFNFVKDRRLTMDFVPVANPDGYLQATRSNSQGVNLNRNFSTFWGKTVENPGTEAFSELETKAIRQTFQDHSYHHAVDIHGYVNWLVLPSPPAGERAKNQVLSKKYAELVKQIAKAKNQHIPGYEMKTPIQLGDGGAFEDWAFWEAGVAAFCLELSTSQRYLPNKSGEKQKVTDLFRRYEAFLFTIFIEESAVQTFTH